MIDGAALIQNMTRLIEEMRTSRDARVLYTGQHPRFPIVVVLGKEERMVLANYIRDIGWKGEIDNLEPMKFFEAMILTPDQLDLSMKYQRRLYPNAKTF